MQEFQTKIGNKQIKVQIGGLAEQASGACLIKCGETSLLCTAQLGEEKKDLPFFPLTCNYEERYYAAGKIGGSRYYRREGKPSTEATLLARMIDRTIRPLFPDQLQHEVQVIATSLSWDEENDPGVLGIVGASIGLSISQIPWQGPVGAVRVGWKDEDFILNPSYEQREQGEMDFVFCGLEKDNDILVNMIEGEAKEVSEEMVKGAYEFALPFIKNLIDFQKDIAEALGQPKMELKPSLLDPELKQALDQMFKGRLERVIFTKDNRERQVLYNGLEEEIKERIGERFGEEHIGSALKYLKKEEGQIVREAVIKHNKRSDGRQLDQVRDLKAKAGLLPRTHGSGFFSRGLTNVISLLTLGAPGDQQLVETMETEGKKRFFHHYNFLPYSAGEVWFLRAPNRREIGHGMLGERALLPLLPDFDDFPYTIRVVSEVLSSNGSTSMAAITAASLALMDAGVPLKAPAAGIAMGLVKVSKDNFKILTDIQGPEDNCGDMDFKVAGTTEGITVMQMDVKIDGITKTILGQALDRARQARLLILNKIKQVIPQPRKNLSPYAPRVEIIEIDPDKIGMVIGSGGRVVNEITTKYDVEIDIEESGKVFVTGRGAKNVKKALEEIENIVKEVEVGEVFQGKVTRILKFGAMVEIAHGKEGLVHISEFCDRRIDKVSDVVSKGDVIPVKVVEIDDLGRINLSARKAGFKPSC